MPRGAAAEAVEAAAASANGGDLKHKSVTPLNADQHVTWYDDPVVKRHVLVVYCTDKELLDGAITLFEMVFSTGFNTFLQTPVELPDHVFETQDWPDLTTVQSRVVGGRFDGAMGYGAGFRGNRLDLSRCARLACCLSALIVQPEFEDEFIQLTSTLPQMQLLATAVAMAFQILPPPGTVPPPVSKKPKPVPQTPMPPVQGGCEQMLLSDGIPLECMEDEGSELRPWNDTNRLWPYCTFCGVWSDATHVNGKNHIRRLQSQGYIRGPDGKWVLGRRGKKFFDRPMDVFGTLVGTSPEAAAAAQPSQESQPTAATRVPPPPSYHPMDEIYRCTQQLEQIPTAQEIYSYNMRAAHLNGFIDFGSLACC